jgi:hypothetical protein
MNNQERRMDEPNYGCGQRMTKDNIFKKNGWNGQMT